jgi:hypothetical protein
MIDADDVEPLSTSDVIPGATVLVQESRGDKAAVGLRGRGKHWLDVSRILTGCGIDDSDRTWPCDREIRLGFRSGY